MTDHHHDEQVKMNGDFLVDPTSLYRDEAQYVLSVAKLVLNHAQNMQMTMDRLQLDCAKFVAMYRNKGDT